MLDNVFDTTTITSQGICPHEEVLTGNYLCAICLLCNIRITDKRRYMPCVALNASSCDMRFILISHDGKNFSRFDVSQKQSDKMFSISFKLNDNLSNYGVKLAIIIMKAVMKYVTQRLHLKSEVE